MSNNETTVREQPTPGSVSEDIRAKTASLRESHAFQTYLRVRERVFAMLDAAQRDGLYKPSAYWQEELENFDYLFDASPRVVEKLRHHTYHITGLRVYDYRTNKAQGPFEAKLRELISLGGADLLVPESPALGGFGFRVDGKLYNIDTLKFYEALVALHRGEVLREFRKNAERKAVWEVGTGWGGFPYQFKTLCPNSTYFLTDFPELFLFSATYLLTLFPQARAAFYGERPLAEILDRWQEYDFVFMPNTSLDEFRPRRLDLAVNMVSFQEMRSDQVDAYARKAFESGCRYLYSLNRDRSSYNSELSNVREIVSKYYWLHDVYVLPVSYTKMMDAAKPGKDKKMAKNQMDYLHVVGWRRVQTASGVEVSGGGSIVQS